MKVLIVDDIYDLRMYLHAVLKTYCSLILFASDGQEAVKIVEENPNLDIVFMDIKMPIMDGMQATEKNQII